MPVQYKGLAGPCFLLRFNTQPQLLPRALSRAMAFQAHLFPPAPWVQKWPRASMASFAGNRGFMTGVNGFNRSENGRGQAYWHNWNGNPYCHYRDGWGCNWYGWGCGSGFCWAQYYGDNWRCSQAAGTTGATGITGGAGKTPTRTWFMFTRTGDYVPAGDNGGEGEAQSSVNGSVDKVRMRPLRPTTNPKPGWKIPLPPPDKPPMRHRTPRPAEGFQQ